MLNIKDLSSPELPKQDNYEQALRLALEVFSRRDPGRVAELAAARFVGRRVILPHLDREIALDLDSQQFAVLPGGQEAPVWLAILAMHYLNAADGGQPRGKLKHFREFKEGQFYEPAFNRRTKEILVAVFGDNPEGMIEAGERLKGKIVQTGDAAVELAYFPCVPITCILWKGDEEFPAEASVLFDETADRFFSAEDMAVAGQMAVLELLKASRG
ncbi:MAG: DUF3786 domain-containing protein [Desulfomonile tiedjei]|nr:DUF3786 domain-containing protein [Desulfomonile tiedjei]